MLIVVVGFNGGSVVEIVVDSVVVGVGVCWKVVATVVLVTLFDVLGTNVDKTVVVTGVVEGSFVVGIIVP